MKKIVIFTLLVMGLAGCSTIGKFMPSNFDNVEYGKLVELNVLSTIHSKKEDWCNAGILNQMHYRAEYLRTYSTHRLNANITSIYEGIHGITKELKERENPSDAYCRIKRQSIQKITTETLAVFGSRKA